MKPRASTWCRNAPTASRDARSGARTRSTSEATSVATIRTTAAPTGVRSAHPQLADGAVGDPQLDHLDVGGVAHQRALVGRRARRDGEHLARAVDQHEARVERARCRADDLGQAGPALDGRGDRVQRGQVESARRF